MTKRKPNQATCRHCHETIWLDRGKVYDDKAFTKDHDCPQGKHHRSIWKSMQAARERAMEGKNLTDPPD